jgi:hypothetical protein
VYTVLFPSGKTLVFSVRALAETYVIAYRGVLLSAPVDFNCIDQYTNSIDSMESVK